VSHVEEYSSGPARLGAPGPRPGRYTHPAAWKNPVVGSKNLMVNSDHLRLVGRSLASMADYLQDELTTWKAAVAPASDPRATGTWQAAAQLHRAIQQTHHGVTQFVNDLVQAHTEVASRLSISADRYDEQERANVEAIRKAASGVSATRVQAGGLNQRISAREAHQPHGREAWNGAVDVTAGAPFSPGSVAGYNWQQVQSMIQSADPDAITNAGHAYKPLYEHLTLISQQIVRHGETLAENWAGPTAVAALSQLQMLNQTASGLQADAYAAGQALSWYGPVLKQFQQHLSQPASVTPPPLIPGATQRQQQTASEAYYFELTASTNLADNMARQRLSELNQRIEAAYYSMPARVKKNLPATGSTAQPNRAGNSTGSGAAPSGVLTGGGPLPPPQQPVILPEPIPPWPHWTGPGNPGPARLAGISALPMTPSGGPPGGLSPSWTIPSGGTPVTGPGVPGLPGGTGGAAGWSVVSDEGSTGGAPSGGGAAGFPMAGGRPRGGPSGQERVRQSWGDYGDEEAWQSPGERAWAGGGHVLGPDGMISAQSANGEAPTPPASGSSPGSGTGCGGQRAARTRTALAAEDASVWTDAEQRAVPPVIG
jgi:hypothetical protein